MCTICVFYIPNFIFISKLILLSINNYAPSLSFSQSFIIFHIASALEFFIYLFLKKKLRKRIFLLIKCIQMTILQLFLRGFKLINLIK
jgi:hypothetical protein